MTPTGNTRPRLLTLREANGRLPISRRSFFRRLADGTIPVLVIGGRTFVDEADIEALLSRKQRRPLDANGPTGRSSLPKTPDAGGSDDSD